MPGPRGHETPNQNENQAAVGGLTAPCFAFLTIYTLPQEIIIAQIFRNEKKKKKS